MLARECTGNVDFLGRHWLDRSLHRHRPRFNFRNLLASRWNLGQRHLQPELAKALRAETKWHYRTGQAPGGGYVLGWSLKHQLIE